MKAADLIPHVRSIVTAKYYGKVKKVIGLMIETTGPQCSIGEICYIHPLSSTKNGEKTIMAEVVGFNEDRVVLMPFTSMHDIAPGNLVESTGRQFETKAGDAQIGKIVDPLGIPIDGTELPYDMKMVNVEKLPPNPMSRQPITEPIEVGVRAIDALLTVGKGQRMGIFAGSGVGKSTLLGMIARNTKADINIIALVGERGREVREFAEKDLGPEGMKKSIIVAATSDQPALMRIKGASAATAIAEYYRDKGFNVMLMMDSVTRVAMAQREIGLAVGEPPATKGYTPSVFSILPKLLERTGTNEYGSITAFYTVLVEGDDMNDPIADTVRGILDGHIVLDRMLANKGHFPSINTLKSISRLMNYIIPTAHSNAANKIRNLISTYEQAEDLVNIGAYKKGSSKDIDQAIMFNPLINSLLCQGVNEKIGLSASVGQLEELSEKGE
ncbi:flagellar protein export ATPase FliI [Jeotgalibacillus sp. S-D1]|uniref:flagellar protein export ATPase FliI n=1 Tax=Jeotgalibacillus sp. S-D1 TaxID=2552189 RepID=UPI0010595108|nr:flagellar protein export ATPase FliI [Jeotgalibacillus sp. S-D1]TDL35043.1 flagellar protein export ATPase FliI [Jeotgalibacillus sp. S-D1]